MTATDRWLTNEDLADRYGAALNTVRDWRKKGTGPHGTRIRGRVLYRESDCEQWEREQEAQQAT